MSGEITAIIYNLGFLIGDIKSFCKVIIFNMFEVYKRLFKDRWFLDVPWVKSTDSTLEE